MSPLPDPTVTQTCVEKEHLSSLVPRKIIKEEKPRLIEEYHKRKTRASQTDSNSSSKFRDYKKPKIIDDIIENTLLPDVSEEEKHKIITPQKHEETEINQDNYSTYANHPETAYQFPSDDETFKDIISQFEPTIIEPVVKHEENKTLDNYKQQFSESDEKTPPRNVVVTVDVHRGMNENSPSQSQKLKNKNGIKTKKTQPKAKPVDHDINLPKTNKPSSSKHPDLLPLKTKTSQTQTIDHLNTADSDVIAPSQPTHITKLRAPQRKRADKALTEIAAAPLTNEIPIEKEKIRNITTKTNKTPKIIENIPIPANIIEIGDNIEMRKDNIICFLCDDGTPLNDTNRLINNNWFSQSFKKSRQPVGSIVAHAVRTKLILAAIIKHRESQIIYEKDMKNALQNLTSIMIEKEIKSASISQEFDNLDTNFWRKIKTMLRIMLINTDIKIFICKNIITVPPEEDRLKIIRENHETPFAGHKGVTKTFNRIREKFHWNQMKRDIEDFVRKCISCQKKKLVRIKTKQPMILTDTSIDVFDKVALDVVGPFPPTKNGNKYVLTMQDDLSKYCLAAPTKRITAEVIAKAFVDNFITRFGSPKVVLTDQGTNFNSTLMKNVAKLFGINQIRSTSFHPQTNGALERSHQVLKDYLKHYIKKNNWDEWLTHAMFAYNTSKHEATNFTPHEVVYGKPARAPSEHALMNPLPTYEDYVIELASRLLEIRNAVRENQENAKLKSKEYYDRKIHPVNFEVGQYVFILKNIKEKNKAKLDDNYIGPYLITNVFPERNNLEICKDNKKRIIHFNQAKPAYVSLPNTETSE